jgi:glycosyltransferase involved in cell wall biosynthesis
MKGSSPQLNKDATQRQQETLEYVLAAEMNAKKKAAAGPKVSIAEARQGAVHYEATSDRETTRLLFISQDTSLLNQTTQSLDGYLNLSEVFDEVHILILQVGLPSRNPVLRVAPNVWLYIVSSKAGLSMVEAAKTMIVEQLEFADGFRADLIVARNPLMCGYLALWASRKYSRPALLHVREDFTQKKYFKKYAYPRLMAMLFRYVMKRFISIRTTTDRLTESLQKEYLHTTDIKTLPRFHNFAAIAQSTASIDIKQKYTQFSFIILYIGQLNHGCRAFQAIDSARNLMRSPKVGLVVLGDGEARTELQMRAKVLGIESQVVFEKNTDDMYSYLKSADVLIVPDTDEFSDELTIKGAAAGIPMVLAHTQQRQDLFTDGDSALFFEDNNIINMSDQMKKVLNDLGVRTALAQSAMIKIGEKLHEDPLAYKLAYRDSVEGALFPEDSEAVV